MILHLGRWIENTQQFYNYYQKKDALKMICPPKVFLNFRGAHQNRYSIHQPKSKLQKYSFYACRYRCGDYLATTNF